MRKVVAIYEVKELPVIQLVRYFDAEEPLDAYQQAKEATASDERLIAILGGVQIHMFGWEQ